MILAIACVAYAAGAFACFVVGLSISVVSDLFQMRPDLRQDWPSDRAKGYANLIMLASPLWPAVLFGIVMARREDSFVTDASGKKRAP